MAIDFAHPIRIGPRERVQPPLDGTPSAPDQVALQTTVPFGLAEVMPVDTSPVDLLSPVTGDDRAADSTRQVATSPDRAPGRFEAILKKGRNYVTDVVCAVGLLASSRLPYAAGLLDDRDAVEPRQWMAQYYVNNGNAKPGTTDEGGDLMEDGTLGPRIDPYLRRSRYYGVIHTRKNELLMGARLILPEEVEGKSPADSLQIRINELAPEQQERVRRLGGAVAELSGFIKRRGLGLIASRLARPILLKSIMQGALDEGTSHVVFAFNPKVAKSYERVFGNVMVPLGESVGAGAFKSRFKPYMIDIVEGVRGARSRGNATFRTPAAYALSSFFGSLQLPGEKVAQER